MFFEHENEIAKQYQARLQPAMERSQTQNLCEHKTPPKNECIFSFLEYQIIYYFK